MPQIDRPELAKEANRNIAGWVEQGHSPGQIMYSLAGILELYVTQQNPFEEQILNDFDPQLHNAVYAAKKHFGPDINASVIPQQIATALTGMGVELPPGLEVEP